MSLSHFGTMSNLGTQIFIEFGFFSMFSETSFLLFLLLRISVQTVSPLNLRGSFAFRLVTLDMKQIGVGGREDMIL